MPNGHVVIDIARFLGSLGKRLNMNNHLSMEAVNEEFAKAIVQQENTDET